MQRLRQRINIILLYFLSASFISVTECHVRFHVSLRVPRYVEMGGSAMLFCEHGVAREQLHKVEWLKDGRKLFQFVRGRSPPYRNFSTPGADLDWTHTNERQVMLRNLQFEASGIYSCEVSTETPIYTKPSNDEQLTVFLKQRGDPEITGRKPGIYTPGESLELNCTASPSRPEADITWLINGHKVDDKLIRIFHAQRTRGNLSSSTAQLKLELTEDHTLEVAGPGGHQLLEKIHAPPPHSGPLGQLHVTCLTTIPDFRGLEEQENHMHPGKFRYADRRFAAVMVDVMAPMPSPDPAAAATSTITDGGSQLPYMSPLLMLVFVFIFRYVQGSR